MNPVEWVQYLNILDRKSWSFRNLIGEAYPLPVVDGGTGTSTVALLVSTLGLSSMAYQASSNVAITGGIITGITNLSSATVSTGTVYATAAVSSVGVSTARVQAGTNVSSGTVSTATVYATDVQAATRVSTATVSSAGVYAATVSTSTFAIASSSMVTNLNAEFIGTQRISSMAVQASSNVAIVGGAINGTAIGATTASTGRFTTLSTSTFAIASSALVANLNANQLQGQVSSYYLDSANFTGTNWTDLTDGGQTNLHQHSSLALGVTTITNAQSPYAVVSSDRYIRCSCASGTITVVMPHASSWKREIYVKKVDGSTSTVTISSVATDTFDGSVTTALASQWATKAFINGGATSWERLNTPTI
jgi:hypothetical protein